MKKTLDRPSRTSGVPAPLTLAASLAVASLLLTAPAHAIEIGSDNPELKIRWDNTVKYSLAVRTESADPLLANAPPPPGPPQPPRFVGNGDRNFDRGLISNRLDLLTEFDLAYRKFGMRVSAAGWYDQKYLSSNDNPGPQNTADGIPFNKFSAAARELHGRDIELLDAFVYGTANLAEEVSLSARLGRHGLQWGESTFFGPNAIAGAMSPADVNKALSVPNSQTKELVRPVPQLSASLNFGSNLAFSGYYQARWEKSVLPAPGSYFSSVDLANQSTGATISPIGTVATPAASIEPKNSGQGGLQMRYSADALNTDFTLFAIQYHSKTPSGVYIYPGALTTTKLVYQQNVKAIGGTFSTAIDALGVGGEISWRKNMALQSSLPPLVGPTAALADNADNARYAIGNTAHAQVNVSYTLPRTVLADEGLLLAEIAWNRRLSVTRNAAALDDTKDRDAWGLQVLFVPTYRQVLPGLDISVPLGVRYTEGKSSALGSGFGVDGGGQVNVGVSGTYKAVYNIGLTYTSFYGPRGRDFFDQSLRDRSFVSLVASTSF